MSSPKKLTALTIEDVMRQVMASPPPSEPRSLDAALASMRPAVAGQLPTQQELLDAVKSALEQFGKYPFVDKGPHEVMDINGLARRFRSHPASAAAGALRSFAHSGKDLDFKESFSTVAAAAIVGELEDWEDLFAQPGIDELYNLEMPALQRGDEPVTGTSPKPKARRARP
jgi:hypothetical protein